MFKTFSGLFSKSGKDLRKRLYITFLFLGIFCLGTQITVPFIEGVEIGSLGVLEIFNLMSGGGLSQFSIFALGVSPYITASIIMQILQMDIIPYFKELKEQGYVGKQKINRITRYLGIGLAFIQAYMFSIYFLEGTTSLTMLSVVIVMTAGTAFCLWMGDQITKKGIGNGQSMLIMAGIIQSMPTIFTGAYDSFITNSTSSEWIGIALFLAFILSYVLIIVGIIWMQLAERKIPIQQANRTASAMNSKQNFLPIKINSAGVIPVIFASIITTIPATIVAFTGNEAAIDFVDKYISYTSWSGFAIYIIFIFLFAYVYTFMAMNPENMSKNLNKNGGYIPGVRPGVDTTNYISKVLSRLTFVGSLFLVILAALPLLISAVTDLPDSVTLGGTGILIVVGVAIETYKQIESGVVSRSYASKRKKLK